MCLCCWRETIWAFRFVLARERIHGGILRSRVVSWCIFGFSLCKLSWVMTDADLCAAVWRKLSSRDAFRTYTLHNVFVVTAAMLRFIHVWLMLTASDGAMFSPSCLTQNMKNCTSGSVLAMILTDIGKSTGSTASQPKIQPCVHKSLISGWHEEVVMWCYIDNGLSHWYSLMETVRSCLFHG